MRLRNRLLITMLGAWSITLVVLGVAMHELLSQRMTAQVTLGAMAFSNAGSRGVPAHGASRERQAPAWALRIGVLDAELSPKRKIFRPELGFGGPGIDRAEARDNISGLLKPLGVGLQTATILLPHFSELGRVNPAMMAGFGEEEVRAQGGEQRRSQPSKRHPASG